MTLGMLPLALLASGLYLRAVIAPVYAGLDLYDYDPAYVYLFNGAGLIEGYAPHHVDHPGTPLQMLCGVVAYVVWLFAGEAPFSAAVFANPEFYLAAVSVVLLALNALATAWLGARVHGATASLPAALTAQSGILLLGALAPRAFHAAPEALVLFSATMSIAVLAPRLFGRAAGFNWPRAVALGFFLALGVTSKITFLPLLALVLLLPSAREALIAAVSTALFGAAFLAPILPLLGQTYEWFRSIAVSTGRYGYGEPGLVDLSKAAGNAVTLAASQPILVAAVLCCALVALGSRLRGGIAFAALVLLAVLLAQLAMVLKHFEVYYALPSIALASTIVAWWAHRALGRRGTAAVAAVMIALAAAQTLLYAGGLKARAAIRDSEIGQLNAELARHPSAIVVGSFRARIEAFGKQYALPFLDQGYARSLAGDGPDWLQYERWKHVLVGAGVEYDLSFLYRLVEEGREVLVVLPRDLDMPELAGETILDLLPDAERVVRVTTPGGPID